MGRFAGGVLIRPLASVSVAALVGCSALLGANFDDARLEADAEDEETFLDVATPTPLPSSIPNLALWLDATRGVESAAGSVTQWHDQSPNARDALPESAAPTPGMAIANKATVHFDATTMQYLTIPSWVGPGSVALTIFVVASGYPQGAVRFQTDLGTPDYAIFPFDNRSSDAGPTFGFEITGASFARVLLDTTRPQLVTGVFADDGTITTYNDGVLGEKRLPKTPVLPTGQTLYVGGCVALSGPLASPPQFFDGDLAEIVVYTAALDDAARTGIESYLRQKWLPQ